LDLVLWIAQVLLALGFLAAGALHAFRFEQFTANPRMGWGLTVGRSNMRIIGLLEIAGAIGVIVPAVTGVLPWLTGYAAAGLVLVMVAAAIFHARRAEPIAPNLVLGALALLVAVGRFVIKPS
jgi:uncharacterized membrane protein